MRRPPLHADLPFALGIALAILLAFLTAACERHPIDFRANDLRFCISQCVEHTADAVACRAACEAIHPADGN